MISPTLIQELLKFDRQLAVKDNDKIGEGWGSVAYRMKSVANDWVVRIPKYPDAPFVGGDLRREASILRNIQGLNLPVSNEIFIIEDNCGRLIAAVHKYIHGSPSDGFAIHGRDNRVKLAHEIGYFLSALHQIPLTSELQNAVPHIDLWTDRYVDLIERSLPKLTLRSRDWLTEISNQFQRDVSSHKISKVLLHGDLSAEHILVDDDINISGVIDFGDAMIADPALDLAGVRWAYGRRLLAQVLKTYTANGCVVDDDFLKRVEFYWKMVPLYLIADGEIFNDGQDFTDGMRQLSSRVAADSRKKKKK
tara:strand:- start:920 stop:1840 length:921 start_codon:yes stop_codon:yes gene_type:complete